MIAGLGLIAVAGALAYWGWVAWTWRSVAMHAIDAYAKAHQVATPTPAPKPEPLPTAILSIVYEQKEDWAQESVAARARELYEELNDWGMVSHQLSQEMGAP